MHEGPPDISEDNESETLFDENTGRRIEVPKGWRPFPKNPNPDKVGTRPQLTNQLHLACFDKDPQRLRELLAQGTPTGNRYRVNALDIQNTPLALAVRRPAKTVEEDANIAAIASMLLEAGAAIEGPEEEDAPLVLACIAGGGVGKAQTVQVLIDAGADLRARCSSLQMTALVRAAWRRKRTRTRAI